MPLTLARWPVALWLCQLVVPGLGLAYGLLRVIHGPAPGAKLAAVMAVCGAWAVAASGAVLVRPVRRWLVARRKQLALCVGTAVATLVAADIALTVSGMVPTLGARRAMSLEYQPAGCTKHRLVPKTFSLDNRQELRINSRGYLGPEIALPKPPGTRRVVFVGESQVFGTYWSDGENWPATVDEILVGRGHKVDVINAGVPNHMAPDSLGKLLTDLWLIEPDVVVVVDCWNDIKYFAELDPAKPYDDVVPLWHGVDLRLHPQGIDRLLCCSALWRMGHDSLITMLMGVGDEGEKLREPVGRVTDHAVRQYRLTLQTICDLGNNIGVEIVLCKQARLLTADSSEAVRQRIPYDYTGLSPAELLRAFELCDRVIDEVAAQKGAAVIDMSAPLSGREELFADHIHFSLPGSRRAAELVADGLQPILDALP